MENWITLDENHPAVQALCRRDKRIQKVVRMIGPITYRPHDENPYGFLVEQILSQMLSNRVAEVIAGRLMALCGGAFTPDAIRALSDEQIRGVGTSNAKVRYIRALTEAVDAGSLDFDALPALPDAEVVKRLTAVRGIGMWSAKMYLLFVLDRPDILPFEDVAFLQGYGWAYNTSDFSPAAVRKKCAKWKPHSSVAARFMYQALDRGFTKEAFHLFK